MVVMAIPSSEEFSNKDYILLLKVCHSINRSRFSGHRDPLEFLGAAWRGWMEARDKFDESKGTRFSTFAIPFIHGRIMDEIRSEMPYSRAVYRMLRKFHSLLDQGVGKSEAVDLVTADCQPSTKFSFIAALMDNDSHFVDEDDAVVEELDLIPDSTVNQLEQLAMAEAMEQVKEIINSKLNWIERQVIQLVYLEELRMREVGHYMDFSDGRVGQIARKAVAKIRSYLTCEHAASCPNRMKILKEGAECCCKLKKLRNNEGLA